MLIVVASTSNGCGPARPAPPISGDIGSAMEGAPAMSRLKIRRLEVERAARDLRETDDGNHKGPSDTFDHDGSSWQNKKAYDDPERYIPGAPMR